VPGDERKPADVHADRAVEVSRQGARPTPQTVQERIAIGVPKDLAALPMAVIVERWGRYRGLSAEQIQYALTVYRGRR
jgi:hypothetical protein